MSYVDSRFGWLTVSHTVQEILHVCRQLNTLATALTRFRSRFFISTQICSKETTPREDHVAFCAIECIAAVNTMHSIGRKKPVLVNQDAAVRILERDVHIVGKLAVTGRFHIASMSCYTHRMLRNA